MKFNNGSWEIGAVYRNELKVLFVDQFLKLCGKSMHDFKPSAELFHLK